MEAISTGLVQLGIEAGKSAMMMAQAPIMAVIQVVIPVALVGVITKVHQETPAIVKPSCFFSDRSLPSGGSLVNMQSLMCNMNQTCHKNASYVSKSEEDAKKRFLTFQKSMDSFIQNGTKLKSLTNLKTSFKAVQAVTKVLRDASSKSSSQDFNLTIGRFFSNEVAVLSILVNETGSFSFATARNFLRGSINLNQIVGGHQNVQPVCGARYLGQIINVTSNETLRDIAKAFCHSGKLNPFIGQKLARLFDIAEILRLLRDYARFSTDPLLAQHVDKLANFIGFLTKFNMREFFDNALYQVISRWFGKLVANGTKSLNLERIQKNMMDLQSILKVMGPFMKSNPIVNSTTINILNSGLKEISSVMTMINKAVKQKSDFNMTLLQFFHNSGEVLEYLNKNIPAGAEFWMEIFQTETRPKGVKQFLENLLVGKTLRQIICESPGLISMICSKTSEKPDCPDFLIVKRSQDLLCLSEATTVSNAFMFMEKRFNASLLSEKIGNRTLPIMKLDDWIKLIKLAHNATKLETFMSTADGIFKFIEKAQPMLQHFAAAVGSDSIHVKEVIIGFGSIMETIQSTGILTDDVTSVYQSTRAAMQGLIYGFTKAEEYLKVLTSELKSNPSFKALLHNATRHLRSGSIPSSTYFMQLFSHLANVSSVDEFHYEVCNSTSNETHRMLMCNEMARSRISELKRKFSVNLMKISRMNFTTSPNASFLQFWNMSINDLIKRPKKIQTQMALLNIEFERSFRNISVNISTILTAPIIESIILETFVQTMEYFDKSGNVSIWWSLRPQILMTHQIGKLISNFIKATVELTGGDTMKISQFFELKNLTSQMAKILPSLPKIAGQIWIHRMYIAKKLMNPAFCKNYTLTDLMSMPYDDIIALNALSRTVCQIANKTKSFGEKWTLRFQNHLKSFAMSNASLAGRSWRSIGMDFLLLYRDIYMRPQSIVSNFLNAFKSNMTGNFTNSIGKVLSQQTEMINALNDVLAILESIWGTDYRWMAFKYYFNAVQVFANVTNARIRIGLAHPNALFADYGKLKTLQNSLFQAIPEFIKSVTPQAILSLPHAIPGIRVNGTLCINFKLMDLLPKTFNSTAMRKFSEDLCNAFPEIEAERKEITDIISTLVSRNITTDGKLNATEFVKILNQTIDNWTTLYIKAARVITSSSNITLLLTTGAFQHFINLWNSSMNDKQFYEKILEFAASFTNSSSTWRNTTAYFVNYATIVTQYLRASEGSLTKNSSLTGDVAKFINAFNRYPELLSHLLNATEELLKHPNKMKNWITNMPYACKSQLAFNVLFNFQSISTDAQNLKTLICSMANLTVGLLPTQLLSVVPETTRAIQSMLMNMTSVISSNSLKNLPDIVSSAIPKWNDVLSEIHSLSTHFNPITYSKTILMATLAPHVAELQKIFNGSPVLSNINRYLNAFAPLLNHEMIKRHPSLNEAINRVMNLTRIIARLSIGGSSAIIREFNETSDGRAFISAAKNVGAFLTMLVSEISKNPTKVTSLANQLLLTNRTVTELLCTSKPGSMESMWGIVNATANENAKQFMTTLCKMNIHKIMPKSLGEVIALMLPTGISYSNISKVEVAKLLSNVTKMEFEARRIIDGKAPVVETWRSVLQILKLTNVSFDNATLDGVFQTLDLYLLLLRNTTAERKISTELRIISNISGTVARELRNIKNLTAKFLFGDLLNVRLANLTGIKLDDLLKSQVNLTMLRHWLKSNDINNLLCNVGISSVLINRHVAFNTIDRTLCTADPAVKQALFVALRSVNLTMKMTERSLQRPLVFFELFRQLVSLRTLLGMNLTVANQFLDELTALGNRLATFNETSLLTEMLNSTEWWISYVGIVLKRMNVTVPYSQDALAMVLTIYKTAMKTPLEPKKFNISTILPNEFFHQMLEAIKSKAVYHEFQLLSSNPMKFITLKNPAASICDEATFRSTFGFKNAYLQPKLCEAARKNYLVIYNVFRHYGFLSMNFTGETNIIRSMLLWSTDFINQFGKLKLNSENFNYSTLPAAVQDMMKMVNSSNVTFSDFIRPINTTCGIVESLLAKSIPKHLMQKSNWFENITAEVLQLVKAVPRLSCSLRGAKFAEYPSAILATTNTTKLSHLLNDKSHKTFSCDAANKIMSILERNVQNGTTGIIRDYNRTRLCLSGVFYQLLNATDELLKLKNQSKMVSSLSSFIPKEMTNVLDLLPSTWKANEKVNILFEKLFGSSGTAKLAENVSITALKLGRAIMQVDVMRIFEMTPMEFKKASCNYSFVQEVFQLPKNLEMSSQLSNFLCSSDPDIIKVIFYSIKTGVETLTIPMIDERETGQIITFFNQTMDLLASMKSLQSLTSVFGKMNVSNISSIIEKIERIPYEVPAQSIQAKATALRKNIYSIGTFSVYNTYLTATESVIHAMIGLEYMKKYVPLKVHATKFFEKKTPIYNYFAKLGITQKEVESFLNLNLSANQIAYLSQGKEIPFILCDRSSRSLSHLGKNTLAKKVRSASKLCLKFSDRDLTNAIKFMSEQGSIVNYIKSDLQLGFDEKIKAEGSSVADIKEIASSFDTMKELETSMASIITDSTPENSTTTTKSTSNSSSAAIGEAMCGSASAMVMNTTDIGGSLRAGVVKRRRRRSTVPKTITTSNFCRDLLVSANSTETGKSVSAFFQPLMLGEIIVTPDVPWVRQVMTKANETYKEIADLKAVLSSMSDTLSKFSSDSGTSLLTDLKSVMKNSMFASVMSVSNGGNDLSGSVNQLQSMVNDKKVKQIRYYLDMMRNFTSCMSTDRIRFYKDENDQSYKNLISNSVENRVYAAINFKTAGADKSAVPKHISYIIRMNKWMTQSTLQLYQGTIPRVRSNYLTDLKYSQGFVQLQENVDKAIIAVQTGTGIKQQPSISTRQFPQPCIKQDNFMLLVGQHLIPVLILLSWLSVLLSSVNDALIEREYNLEKALYVMGRKPSLRWITWSLSHFLNGLVLTTIMTISLRYGGVLKDVDGFIIFITFIFYSFSVLMFGFFISALFDITSLALLTAVMLYLLSYVPFAMTVSQTVGVPAIVIKIAMILPVTPMASISHYWASYQVTGLSFSAPQLSENLLILSPGACLAVLLADGILYLVLGWYIRNAFAGSRGISRSFLFFLSKRYWGIDDNAESLYALASKTQGTDFTEGITNSNIYDKMDMKRSSNSSGSSEPCHSASIIISNLTKKFKSRSMPAVNDVSFNLRRGETTVLLGPNGAGKSTLISMILGLLKPSSGSITIQGLDREKNYHALRRKIGFCPQHDIFYPNLSVKENLSYFVSIKGRNMSKSEQKIAVIDALNQVDLKAMAKLPAKKLSGGQKRRLSIAIAFIGSSDVVVLDEPTSGVDPTARRMIWNLISAYKTDRTVLLCTHHIDEAEIVGDRIAILNDSRLVAYDSPKRLRSTFGSRYDISFKSSEENKDFGLKGNLKTARNIKGNHCEYTVSMNPNQTNSMEMKDTLENLEHYSVKGIVNSICLSFTSLENTFMKIIRSPMEIPDEKGEPSKSCVDSFMSFDDLTKIDDRKISNLQDNEEENVLDDVTYKPQRENRKCLSTRIIVLLKKQFLHTTRNWKTYVAQFILPCVFLALTLASTKLLPNYFDSPPLLLSPSIHGPDSMSFVKPPPMSSNSLPILSIMEGPGIGTVCLKNPSKLNYHLTCGKKVQVLTDPGLTTSELQKYLDASSCICDSQRGRLSCPSKYSKGTPAKMIQIPSTDKIIILQPNKSTPVPEYLRVKSSSFTTDKTIIWGGWEFKKNSSVTVWFNTQGLHTLPAYFNALSNILLRGLMAKSGKSELEETMNYGISAYSHPFKRAADQQYTSMDVAAKLSDISISLGILISMTMISTTLCLRTLRERLTGEKFLMQLYGISPVCYWTVNYIWDVIISTVTLPIVGCLIFATQVPYFSGHNWMATIIITALYLFSSLPLCYMITRISKSLGKGFLVTFLSLTTLGFFLPVIIIINETMLPEKTQMINAWMEKIFMIVPSAAFGFGLTKLMRHEIISGIKKELGVPYDKNIYGPDVLLYVLVFLAMEAIVFFGLNLLFEIQCVRKFFNRFHLSYFLRCRRQEDSKHSTTTAANWEDDIGVRNECRRVQETLKHSESIILRNLKKNFFIGKKKIQAVSGVSFGVAEGECVGLLGMNGAGKTSLFKCITGEIPMTDGEIAVRNKSVGMNVHLLDGKVGYCPQVDPLDPLLTVNETIVLYAQLRGVDASTRHIQAEELQKSLGIEQYRNVKIKHLSCGTRRKLSIALALVGEPKVLLLDEPTSGVDVVSKKRIWKLLSTAKLNAAVLLTSHNMEEMQLIGDKLAIMVNGKLRAFGTGLELTSNYGLSFHLQVWADKFHSLRVSKILSERFTGCYLKSRKGNLSEFSVPVHSSSLSRIFDIMAQMKNENEVDDFVLQNTSLEHIFLQLTSPQSEEIYEEVESNGKVEKPEADWYEAMSEKPLSISSIKLGSQC